MENDKPLKPIVFHSSFEEQRLYGQSCSIRMTIEERLAEMYRLNRKIYGEQYGKLSKTTELHVGLPGESVNDFYKRIDSEKETPITQRFFDAWVQQQRVGTSISTALSLVEYWIKEFNILHKDGICEALNFVELQIDKEIRQYL